MWQYCLEINNICLFRYCLEINLSNTNEIHASKCLLNRFIFTCCLFISQLIVLSVFIYPPVGGCHWIHGPTFISATENRNNFV